MPYTSAWCRRHLDNEQLAVLYVRNALHGRRPEEPSPESVWAQTVYHNRCYRWPYIALATGVLIQTTWEPPSAVAVSDSLLALIRTLDILFMCFVVFDLWLQYRCDGFKVWIRRGWIRAKLIFTFAMAINLFVHIALPGAPYALRVLRPFYLIERMRNVRRVAQNIAATAVRIINVIIMLGAAGGRVRNDYWRDLRRHIDTRPHTHHVPSLLPHPGDYAAIHLLVFSVLCYSLFGGIDANNCSASRRTGVPYCSTSGATGCTDYFSTFQNTAMQM